VLDFVVVRTVNMEMAFGHGRVLLRWMERARRQPAAARR
jgi:hypothetical protein